MKRMVSSNSICVKLHNNGCLLQLPLQVMQFSSQLISANKTNISLIVTQHGKRFLELHITFLGRINSCLCVRVHNPFSST